MLYKIKLAEIEAVKWTGENFDNIKEFLGYAPIVSINKFYSSKKNILYIKPNYLEARPDDYIIKTSNNMVYVLKSEIFLELFVPKDITNTNS